MKINFVHAIRISNLPGREDIADALKEILDQKDEDIQQLRCALGNIYNDASAEGGDWAARMAGDALNASVNEGKE